MKRNNDTRRITFSEIGNTLAQNLGSVDGARAAELTGLARVRQAKATQLAREHTRLTEKYGANDARVQAIAAQRATNAIVVANIEREALRAQTPMPAPDDNAWIVHGHVFGPDRAPQAERVLTLHDANGKPLIDTQARTDSNGHFVLCVTRPQKTDDGQDNVTPGATRGPALNLSAQATAPNTVRAYLHVSDIAGKLLHRDTHELTPALGQVDYREITLSDDPCAQKPPRGKPDTGGGTPNETPREPPSTEPSTQPYVGNPATRELHDTQKITKRCKLDAIKPDARVYFANTAEAEKVGYDYCAFCFGKEKSKR